jgi:hypothetical protein
MRPSIFVLLVLLAFWLLSRQSGYKTPASSSNLNAISYGGNYGYNRGSTRTWTRGTFR